MSVAHNNSSCALNSVSRETHPVQSRVLISRERSQSSSVQSGKLPSCIAGMGHEMGTMLF